MVEMVVTTLEMVAAITAMVEMGVTILEMVVTITAMVDTTTVETIKETVATILEMETVATILESNLKNYSINVYMYLFQYLAHNPKVLTLQGLKIAVVCRTLNKF